MTEWFKIHDLVGCHIKGRDALTFCQSQFTADVSALTPTQWQPTAWCSPKGRVKMVIVARQHQGDVEIIFPATQSAFLREMGRFTIGRNVELDLIEGVAGAYTSDASAPIANDRFNRALRLHSKPDGSIRPDNAWQEQWALQDIILPLPWLGTKTQDRFLPQALGLESNGGLSYTKGCYPGQEIVARVHYLGRAPERLVGLNIAPTDQISIDALIGADARTAERKRMTLLSAAHHDGNWLALAVAANSVGESGPIEFIVDDIRLTGHMTPPASLC